jgi:ADP-ribosylglycohydrolase
MSTTKDGIYGVLVGDMLGVPVEFMRREALQENPVTGPREGGSHEQPVGAWSDDGALTLALADALADGYSLERIARNFVAWWQDKKYTSHDRLFDIGQRTLLAFNELFKILESQDYEAFEYLHFEAGVNTNGNGTLMRTFPLYPFLQKKGIEENFQTIWQVSALTHPHIRSALACLVYLIFIDELVKRKGDTLDTLLVETYRAMQQRMQTFMASEQIDQEEVAAFARILDSEISIVPEPEIKTSAYVMDTLEASLWCLLNTGSYEEAVLKAVNLGHDTDTTGAVTGGLAGVLYGKDSIPDAWLEVLPKQQEIDTICSRLT